MASNFMDRLKKIVDLEHPHPPALRDEDPEKLKWARKDSIQENNKE